LSEAATHSTFRLFVTIFSQSDTGLRRRNDDSSVGSVAPTIITRGQYGNPKRFAAGNQTVSGCFCRLGLAALPSSIRATTLPTDSNAARTARNVNPRHPLTRHSSDHVGHSPRLHGGIFLPISLRRREASSALALMDALWNRRPSTPASTSCAPSRKPRRSPAWGRPVAVLILRFPIGCRCTPDARCEGT